MGRRIILLLLLGEEDTEISSTARLAVTWPRRTHSLGALKETCIVQSPRC